MVKTNRAVDILHTTECTYTSNEVLYSGQCSTWDVIVAPRCLPRQPGLVRGYHVGHDSPRLALDVEPEFQNVGLCKNVLAQCFTKPGTSTLSPRQPRQVQAYCVVQYIPTYYILRTAQPSGQASTSRSTGPISPVSSTSLSPVSFPAQETFPSPLDPPAYPPPPTKQTKRHAVSTGRWIPPAAVRGRTAPFPKNTEMKCDETRQG